MVRFLDRYYGLILALSVPAPLWLSAMISTRPMEFDALWDGAVWSALLLGGWALVRLTPRYQIRGTWRRPSRDETKLYLRLLLAVLIVDFGSKALFFRWDHSRPVEIFKNFGLQSVFHPTPFETFHVVLMVYFFYLLVLGPLYFRFFNRALDRIWIGCCAVGLGGTAALILEKWLFNGVHNSFYITSSATWDCPTCVAPIAINYVWTPADFFWHMSFMPIFLLPVSYFYPSTKAVSGHTRATLLQEQTP